MRRLLAVLVLLAVGLGMMPPAVSASESWYSSDYDRYITLSIPAWSTIDVPDFGVITDVDVYVKVDYPRIGHIEHMRLFHFPGPQGEHWGEAVIVTLMSEWCDTGAYQNLDATFDDEGVSHSCAPPGMVPRPAISGNVIPDNPLSAFDGEDMWGEWVLEVPTEGLENGWLREWGLRIEWEGGSIVVRKLVSAGAPAATFTFDPSWGENFTLTAGHSAGSGALLPGVYSVVESVPRGWSLRAACSDGSSPGAINLSDGERVTCTFTNSYPMCLGMPATIVGTPGADTLTGTRRADVIVGLGGKDTISGLGGNDRICGGAGADQVDGGDGNDLIQGNRGADSLLGGSGSDRLWGGMGTDLANGGPGSDVCSAETRIACE